ncbi:ClpXP adapter SpxH family protein [Pseudalkalibacillus berkeleyi]|uniref:ClpXP adapter protein SpxH n=1 Tax=Pseudalkalibacillus berkeleyi TaxID=1069813 RepID=A0ABS9GYU3_9BACL|nr:ClpXP adapter SpxH family protein [Pseudalkalibacillus berkeleyi]MCF6136860.1 DsbA family protein [Pseudalkalibacillus berkeleyi]
MMECESGCDIETPNKNKPVEIYSFVDPLCPECWGLEPVIKKLQIEYGNHFRLRHLMGGRIDYWNSVVQKKNGICTKEDVAKKWEITANRSGMSCDGDVWYEDPIQTPYVASIAVKAAELQGKSSGMRFLRKLREVLFLQKQNITKVDVITDCAKSAGLDVDEFQKDLHSDTAVKAFQCDVKTTQEMEVSQLPSLVFFSDTSEEGIKITGMYSYEVYVHILEELIGDLPDKCAPPSLEKFLKKYQFVATKEIAEVYNLSPREVESQMKKLTLQQIVERVPVKHGTFWRYNNKNSQAD